MRRAYRLDDDDNNNNIGLQSINFFFLNVKNNLIASKIFYCFFTWLILNKRRRQQTTNINVWILLLPLPSSVNLSSIGFTFQFFFSYYFFGFITKWNDKRASKNDGKFWKKISEFIGIVWKIPKLFSNIKWSALNFILLIFFKIIIIRRRHQRPPFFLKLSLIRNLNPW